MDYRKIAENALAERARIFEQRKALMESDKTDAEKREQAERMDADMDRLAAEARQAVEAGEREAELRDLSNRAGALGRMQTPGENPKPDERAEALAEGFRAVALGEARSYEFEVSSRAFDTDAIGLIETVTDGTSDNYKTNGGVAATVTPDTFVATLLESAQESSDLLAKVSVMTTSGGEVQNWPRRTSRVTGAFQHVLEANKYPSVTDGDFSLVAVSAHKFGAIAEIPFEALSDPALNIASLVASEMGENLAESLAAAIYNGTVVTQNIADNVVIDTTIPLFSADGSASDVPVLDALIDVQHSIRTAYRRNASWTISDDLARKVRQIKDAENHYIWQPAVTVGAPDMLLGKPVSVEYLMPEVAASALGALYGDLSKFYRMRTVRSIGITRSDEYGFDRDTVALKIVWRGDGFVYDPQALASGTFAAA